MTYTPRDFIVGTASFADLDEAMFQKILSLAKQAPSAYRIAEPNQRIRFNDEQKAFILEEADLQMAIRPAQTGCG